MGVILDFDLEKGEEVQRSGGWLGEGRLYGALYSIDKMR